MNSQDCPDCDPTEIGRRRFMRVVGTSATGLAAVGVAPLGAFAAPQSTVKRKAKPAEALIRELYAGMNSWQRENLVYDWNHGAGGHGSATRLRIYNRSLGVVIGEAYTRSQRELVEKILKSISSGEAGYEKISRGGRWDTNGGLLNCGAHIFGDPTKNGKFSFVFSGHHMTIRCDGNSEPNAAFGGPIFYGHSPQGYSKRNVFHDQTEHVKAVFETLDAKQRQRAIVSGSPGQGQRSVQFRGKNARMPGIGADEITAPQMKLVESVMRELLAPYRKEDVDEVMQIVKKNGGMEKLHLAFYGGRNATAREPWDYWRLEGPGFVWSFRVLPHVHTYVNIAAIT